MDTEMQEETTLRGYCQASGKDIPRIGAATGKQDIGRAPVPGPYPYADRDTARKGKGTGFGIPRARRMVLTIAVFDVLIPFLRSTDRLIPFFLETYETCP
jgi:hypothetical protein